MVKRFHFVPNHDLEFPLVHPKEISINKYLNRKIDKELQEKADNNELLCGTIDSWLLYKLTGGNEFKTDVSNADAGSVFL